MSIQDACRLAGDMLGVEAGLSSLTPDVLNANISALVWDPLSDWESLGDTEIAKTTGLLGWFSQGTLVVVTEASIFGGVGAFVIPASKLTSLITEHLRLQGEAFFNGDVVILAPDAPAIWMFHHVGVFARVRLSPPSAKAHPPEPEELGGE